MTIPFENNTSPDGGIRVEHFSFLLAMGLFLFLIAAGIPSFLIGGGTPSLRQTLRMMGDTDPEALAIKTSQAAFSGTVFPDEEEGSALPAGLSLRTHKVQEGETISRIAGIYGLKPETILAVNHKDDIRKIRPGRELLVPLVDGYPYRVENRDTPAGVADKLALTGDLRALFLETWPVLPPAGKEIFVPGDSPFLDRYRNALSRWYLYPVTGTVITDFGDTTDPVTGLKTFYEGIDIASERGTPVKASRSGLVVRVQVHQSLGYCVIIRHDDGITTLYGQLEEPAVTEGARVEQGAILGKVGNKVYGKVDHLYFSVKKNGRVIDPLTILY
jgi:murein DD-endopeptidase MepM/ murein hydrolase activator NlpD